jgi:hypothetical protein
MSIYKTCPSRDSGDKIQYERCEATPTEVVGLKEQRCR